MSDKNSAKARGVESGGHAELTNSSLINLADEIGNIFFQSDGFDDVSLWLGLKGDKFITNFIPQSNAPRRTTTTVHAGEGKDTMLINLDSQNEGSVFVANGQGGQDILNASNSALNSLILIGDAVSLLVLILFTC